LQNAAEIPMFAQANRSADAPQCAQVELDCSKNLEKRRFFGVFSTAFTSWLTLTEGTL